jgi:sulfite reductase (ferredoxin)
MKEWKEILKDEISAELTEQINIFETQIELKKLGKIDDKIFAETRLRKGVYGQRYDNGQRHDGEQSRKLKYPSGDKLKGPETVWDAPGMLRIKIPFGAVTPNQMRVLADLSEEYADAVVHITTRQDIQYHFVHIEDTPTIMRRLAAVGITTHEACGNVIRNVTACPLAGVCQDETFDVSPYAKAMAEFMLNHPDCQDFGRKFKIAFSGCSEHACGIVNMHDLGGIAKTRDGKNGFEIYVGGGLGAVAHQAKVMYDFLPEEEILPLMQAIGRVFARLGEKKNRAKARVKFLVAKLGLEEFTRLVEEEREILPHDERWTSYLDELSAWGESPIKDPSTLNGETTQDGFNDWMENNVISQRQDGYKVVVVMLPLGDISSHQTRKLADIAEKYIGDYVRTTVEQNFVLRWVSESDLPGLYQELNDIGLADPGAGTIVDITSCPGTDTCKLGIASSRGLAEELRQMLAPKQKELDEAVRNLRIKTSGCFNSCGQHHIADMGFYGNSRTFKGYKVPHFQVVLGGQWKNNAGSFGLAIGAVPSKNIPKVVLKLADYYVENRADKDVSFQDFISSRKKSEIKEQIQEFMEVPPYLEDASFYTDWGDPRVFTLGDMGVGECAGEVVSLTEVELQSAERICFEAQVELEDGKLDEAEDKAYKAMIRGASALLRKEFQDISSDPDEIVTEFKQHFYDTKLFWDRFAHGKFGKYLINRNENPPSNLNNDSVHRKIEESQLFIEAAHACYAKMMDIEKKELSGKAI